MAENSYTGFGSQIVFKPKHLSLTGNDKNVNDSVVKCRNLRLQLKYFTIQAQPESSVNNVNATTTLRDYGSCNNSVDIDKTTDERVLLIKTDSCESFHSCHSFLSKENLLKNTEYCRKMKNRHQYSTENSLEEGFLDQITMINAIFLDKKSFQNVENDLPENRHEIKHGNILDERIQKAPESSIHVESSSIDRGQCSGDRGSANDSKYFKPSSLQDQIENKIIISCGKGKDREYSGVGKTTLFNEKLCTDSSVLKTFKINRRISFGTRKPFTSKPISRRRVHQAIIHKVQPFKIHEVKYSGENIQSDGTPHIPEVDEELYKSTLLLYKKGINEGYEMHFLDPIQVMNKPITFYSQNLKKYSNTDVLLCDKEVQSSQNLECKVVNSYDDFAESFLKLFNKLQKSNTSVQLLNEKKQIEISTDFVNESPLREANKKFNSKGNIKSELIEDHDSHSGKFIEQGDLTVLYKSETQYSDLSLNETFLEILENKDCTEETDIKYLNEETTKGHEIIDNSNIMEYSESETKKKREQDVNTEYFPKTRNHNYTDSAKDRTSSNKKSVLPVIEESLEETSTADISDNDYCLVDTLGRPIHLFDHRGLPLTDGSGRPLRSAVGEALMKCDNSGIPVVDEEAHIFDMFGKQPHEGGFQPWMSPQINGASRLTSHDGRPLVLFDLQGRPLTSISGTLLVDSSGRSLLKLRNCFVPSTVCN